MLLALFNLAEKTNVSPIHVLILCSNEWSSELLTDDLDMQEIFDDVSSLYVSGLSFQVQLEQLEAFIICKKAKEERLAADRLERRRLMTRGTGTCKKDEEFDLLMRMSVYSDEESRQELEELTEIVEELKRHATVHKFA